MLRVHSMNRSPDMFPIARKIALCIVTTTPQPAPQR
jgi:hypothetical protein